MASDDEGEFSPTEATQAEATSRGTSRTSGSGYGALFWFTGWLFTIGFASLVWWQGLLALCVWPYYLGVALMRL